MNHNGNRFGLIMGARINRTSFPSFAKQHGARSDYTRITVRSGAEGTLLRGGENLRQLCEV